MKKLIYLLILAVLITACSKNDATPSYLDSKLIGEWIAEGMHNHHSETINLDTAENYIFYGIADYEYGLIFRPDTVCGYTLTLKGIRNNAGKNGNRTNSYFVEGDYFYIKLGWSCSGDMRDIDGWNGLLVSYRTAKYKFHNNKLIIGINDGNYCEYYLFRRK
jgi:hypothetical protein